jgi:hypothetical protein
LKLAVVQKVLGQRRPVCPGVIKTQVCDSLILIIGNEELRAVRADEHRARGVAYALVNSERTRSHAG